MSIFSIATTKLINLLFDFLVFKMVSTYVVCFYFSCILVFCKVQQETPVYQLHKYILSYLAECLVIWKRSWVSVIKNNTTGQSKVLKPQIDICHPVHFNVFVGPVKNLGFSEAYFEAVFVYVFSPQGHGILGSPGKLMTCSHKQGWWSLERLFKYDPFALCSTGPGVQGSSSQLGSMWRRLQSDPVHFCCTIWSCSILQNTHGKSTGCNILYPDCSAITRNWTLDRVANWGKNFNLLPALERKLKRDLLTSKQPRCKGCYVVFSSFETERFTVDRRVHSFEMLHIYPGSSDDFSSPN